MTRLILIASCIYAGTAELASAAEPVATLRHDQCLYSVALSPDGQWLGVGATEGNVYVWNWKDGKQIASWAAHTSAVSSLFFVGDGKQVITASHDATTRLWEVDKNREIWVNKENSFAIASARLLPNGKLFVTATRTDPVTLWDIAGKKIGNFGRQKGKYYSLSVSLDGNLFAVGNEENVIRVFDHASGMERCSISAHDGVVSGVGFLSDGNLISTGFDEIINKWDLTTKKNILSISSKQVAISALAVTSDGKFFATAGIGGTVKIWNANDCTEAASFVAHTDKIWSIVFSADGTTFASCSSDKTAKIWKMEHLIRPKIP